MTETNVEAGLHAPPDTVQRGDQVPHFDVRTLDGDRFRYATIWQRQNLVLITLPKATPHDGYPCTLTARGAAFQEHDSVCVITCDPVAGVPTPGALVADRWGEIVYVAGAAEVAGLPAPSDLLDWLDYVERRCPECEGEAR